MTKTNQRIFLQLFTDLRRLFFPDLCVCCLQPTPSPTELLCIRCLVDLPHTNFQKDVENPFTERFFGRLILESGTALFHFEKKGRVQKVIHALKYGNRPDVGRLMGQMLGKTILGVPHFQGLDAIIPVPLHPMRQRKRGYNQSACLAEGISTVLKIPFYENALSRLENTTSQTNKSRLERFQNVESVFEVSEKMDLRNMHLLLVDDVLTTGATLEACGAVLLKEKGVRLSVATLAIAEN